MFRRKREIEVNWPEVIATVIMNRESIGFRYLAGAQEMAEWAVTKGRSKEEKINILEYFLQKYEMRDTPLWMWAA